MSVRRRLNSPDFPYASHTSLGGNTPSEEIRAEVLSVDGQPVYQAELRQPEAIVVHCGDPRFQTAFRRFVTEELGIPVYIPVVLGGGVHALGAQTFLPKNFKVLWQQIKFMRDQFNITDIVLINHDDCRWYQRMSGLLTPHRAAAKGRVDLPMAAKLLLQDFAGVRVRSYWAALDGDKIFFKEVAG